MTEELKVEKNIPLPARNKITFAAGKIGLGDSIFFKTKPNLLKIQTYLRVKGIRSTIRTVEGGFRLWRIK